MFRVALIRSCLTYASLMLCAADAVYTRAGPCLVAVNPYRVVLDRNGDSIVDPVYMYRYKDRVSVKLLNSLPPSKRAKLVLPVRAFMPIVALTWVCWSLVVLSLSLFLFLNYARNGLFVD
jgi:hypothetical protein